MTECEKSSKRHSASWAKLLHPILKNASVSGFDITESSADFFSQKRNPFEMLLLISRNVFHSINSLKKKDCQPAHCLMKSNNRVELDSIELNSVSITRSGLTGCS